MDYNPFRSGRATQQTVQESKFLIPEEIPAQERTAFHGAAAAAHKAGKSHFSFNGKKHPVTMKKDTANAIADQKEDTKLDELSPSTLQSYSKKAKKQAVGLSQKGDKKDLKKFGNRIKGISQADDKMKEGYMKDLDTEKSEPSPRSDAKVAADFKKRRKMNKPAKAEGGGKEGDVAMNPKMDSEKKEQKESKIRSALKSVLEASRDDHYKGATKPEMMKDKIKGKGAEDMMKAADDAASTGPEAHLNEPEIDKKNFEKMTSNVPSKKMRKNDNPKGDTKIVPAGTQFKDPAAMKAEGKNEVTPFKVESYDKMTGLKAAYASMYAEKTEEEKENNDAD